MRPCQPPRPTPSGPPQGRPGRNPEQAGASVPPTLTVDRPTTLNAVSDHLLSHDGAVGVRGSSSSRCRRSAPHPAPQLLPAL